MFIDRSKYSTVTTVDQLDWWVDEIMRVGFCAFDTETTGLDFMQDELVGISLATAPELACYIPVGHEEGEQLPIQLVLDRLKPVLEHPFVTKVMQNGKFDVNIMARYGIDVNNIDDAMLMAYSKFAGLHRFNMDELARRYLGADTLSFSEIVGRYDNFAGVPLRPATAYAAEDADVTLRLAEIFRAELADDPDATEIYTTIEQPLIKIISRMERRGILVDTAYLQSLTEEFTKSQDDALEQAVSAAGHDFNPASPRQLGAVLERLGVQIAETTGTGQMATSAEVLEELLTRENLEPRQRSLISSVLEWRKFSKLISNYSSGLQSKVNPYTGRVHPSFGMASTDTGRLACSEPNLQTIPIRTKEGQQIRRAFIAEPGHKLISADYSQIELRVLASMSGDRALLKAFETGLDIHQATAAEVWGVPYDQVTPEQRRSAKAVNFGIVYGQTERGLARSLGISDLAARKFIDSYFARFPGIQDYIAKARRHAELHRYVSTISGRKIWFQGRPGRWFTDKDLLGLTPPPNWQWGRGGEGWHLHAHGLRSAQNAPIQGTATGDIIKTAMIKVDKALAESGLKTVMLLQVHDELLFESPDSEVAAATELIKGVMESAVDYLNVPLVVEAKAADNWLDAH